MVLLSTATGCDQKGDTPIPVTPEVSTVEKKKPKRSAKPKREQPENALDATIQSVPDLGTAETRPVPPSEPPKTAPMPNGVPPAKETYEWDRTIAEDAKRAEDSATARTPFPIPKNTTLAFPELCAYYNALRELPVGRYARLYVARWWPVLLPVEAMDDFGNIKDSFPNDVKITAQEGPLSQQIILQLAGVGEYRFRLNDSRRPWKQQTVVFSELDAIDPSLWTLHPPIIDPKRLDLDAKRNQAYIKFARAHGYLPHEGAIEKEQDNMANAAITDRALDEASKERARADLIQREQLDRARAEAEQAKAATARAETEAAEAKRQAEDLKTKIQPGTPASELLSVVSSVATLANSLKPADSFKEYLALEGQREQTRRDREKQERDDAREAARIERARADTLQAEVIAILTAPPAVAIAPVAPRTDLDLMEEMVKKQALLKQLTGRGGPAESEEDKPGRIDKWLEAAPVVGPVIQTFLQGLFQSFQYGLQTWQTISYNNALLRNGTTPQPPTTMNQQQPATTAQPGQPQPANAPLPTPEQQAQHQRLITMLKALEDAAEPILLAFTAGESDAVSAGFNFADTIITFKGRPDYDLIRTLGAKPDGTFELDIFTQNIRFFLQHPGRGKNTAHLAEKVGPKPSFGQFLAGFFNRDQIKEELAEAQRQAEQGEHS